jgi:hypothetical protein
MLDVAGQLSGVLPVYIPSLLEDVRHFLKESSPEIPSKRAKPGQGLPDCCSRGPNHAHEDPGTNPGLQCSGRGKAQCPPAKVPPQPQKYPPSASVTPLDSNQKPVEADWRAATSATFEPPAGAPGGVPAAICTQETGEEFEDKISDAKKTRCQSPRERLPPISMSHELAFADGEIEMQYRRDASSLPYSPQFHVVRPAMDFCVYWQTWADLCSLTVMVGMCPCDADSMSM